MDGALAKGSAVYVLTVTSSSGNRAGRMWRRLTRRCAGSRRAVYGQRAASQESLLVSSNYQGHWQGATGRRTCEGPGSRRAVAGLLAEPGLIVCRLAAGVVRGACGKGGPWARIQRGDLLSASTTPNVTVMSVELQQGEGAWEKSSAGPDSMRGGLWSARCTRQLNGQ